MRNLINFIVKYYFVFFFVIFESLSIFLLVQNNHFQKAKFVNFTRAITASAYQRISTLENYFALKKSNEELENENIRLLNSLRASYFSNKIDSYSIFDTLYQKQYNYNLAEVINNSTNKQYNFLTINKGRKQNIKPDMTVVCSSGVVGVVANVSDNFATVISVLNRKLMISAKFKKSGYYGSLSWDGIDDETAELNEITQDVKMKLGDTLVTSGYSSMFPAGIMIGYIKSFEIKGGSFYTVKVRLSTNFRSIHFVNVVENLMKEEQNTLEKSEKND
jgi:rod shape-determining protein MreC